MGISAIGVIKEAFYYQAVPFIQSVSENAVNQDIYSGIYSVMTWVSYSFSVPAAFIMGLYFYGLNKTNPKLMLILKTAVWFLPLVLSFIYSPLRFKEYQAESRAFWIVYSAYYIGFGIIVIVMMLRGISIEKSEIVKQQKRIL